MTALLACDGCGQIVSDRPDDDDPTGAWWMLTPAPSIGGGLMPLATITFDPTGEVVEEGYEDPPPPEPDRHFCCLHCLLTWSQRRLVETRPG